MPGWALLWQVVVWIATTAISAAMTKVPKGGPASGADKFTFPTASEDRSIPVIFGPRWVKGPNTTWWGRLLSRAIKQSAGKKYGFFGPKRYTVINYIFSVGMHLVFAHRADKLIALKIGNDVLAEGLNVTANTTITINKPDLFGGKKSGGGFVGPIDIEFGLPSQPVNSYLDTYIDGPVSAHRGVVGMVLRDCEITAAPPGADVTVQPISALISATTSMCDWYPAKVTLPSGGMNGAHMIRVCATRQEWNNQQYEAEDIDDATFTAAADILYAEDFGLAAEISDEAVSAEDAIGEILRHIDGTLYENKFTGKLCLKLNRGGYDIGSLPLFNNSIVKSVEEYTRTGWGERVNQVTVSYYDLEADKQRSTAPLYDPAALEVQGGIVSRVQSYPWIFQPEIAAQLVERDLRQLTADLGVATIIANRQASGLEPGDLFRWTCPEYGVIEIVMRVKRIDYGSLTDGSVRILCAQDIFSLPAAIYSAPPPSGWEDPVNDPAPAAVRAVFEAPFWLAGPGAFNPDTGGTILALAGRPTPDALDFEVWAGTPYAEVTDNPGAFSEFAVITAAVSAPAASFPVTDGVTGASVGQLAIIEAEIVRVDAVGAGTITVSRGMLDTVPVPHASGARLVVFEDNLALEAYANGAAVNVKLLPATIRGRLALASAPADAVTMNRRHLRPYPPGDLRINTVSYPADAYGTLTASWAHRDRLQQLTEPLLTQSAASIGPEAGTTYTARWYLDGALVRTQASITGTSDDYTPPAGSGGKSIRVEVESIRDGIASWQRQTHTFTYGGHLITEAGDPVVTEAGDPILLE
jgi:hypothetical protein